MRAAWIIAPSLIACAVAGTRGETGAPAAQPITYAVAADHPLASAAGAEILRAGGNAADAAVATALALGVVSPSSSGLGGGGFALYYRAIDKSLTFLDFRERAPQGATADMFAARPGDDDATAKARSQRGGLAIGVPGEPAGLAELASRFGSRPLATLIEPARKLAKDGFRVGAHLAAALGALDANALLGAPLGALTKQSVAGELVRNAALADTLAQLGQHGAQHFYRGALGRAIVAAARRSGGVLSESDLADYRVQTRAPLRTEAFGYEWITAPAPSAGGYTVLTSLELLERWAPDFAAKDELERSHMLAESWKGPYLDRERYFGDPDHVAVPMDALFDGTRIDARAALFRSDMAQAPSTYALPLAEEAAALPAEDHGTTHLCVVDAEGNVAALTSTVNLGFGAQVSVAGLWLNDEMDDFAREVGKANAFGLSGGAANLPAPGKRPVSTMMPTIVLRDGAPVLCVGASGGSRIATATEQVAIDVLLLGMEPEAAVRAPRLHHQAKPDVLTVRDVSEATERALAARGHVVEPMSSSAHVQVIGISRREGVLSLKPASDPGKGGAPAGRY